MVGISIRVNGDLVTQLPVPLQPGNVFPGGTSDNVPYANLPVDDANYNLSMQTGGLNTDLSPATPQPEYGDPTWGNWIKNLEWARFEAEVSETGHVIIRWKGVELTPAGGLPTGFSPIPARILLGGRTAGAWEVHHLDNLRLEVSGGFPSVLVWLQQQDEFGMFVSALKSSGALAQFRGTGRVTTCFALTDSTIQSLPEGMWEGLLADPSRLRETLLLHFLRGRWAAADLRTSSVVTVQGAAVEVMETGGLLSIGGLDVTDPDAWLGDDGAAHVINGLLTPPPTLRERIESEPKWSTMRAWMDEVDFWEQIGPPLPRLQPFTVFVPTDDALALLSSAQLDEIRATAETLSEYLAYHFVPSVRWRKWNGRPSTRYDTLALLPLHLDSESAPPPPELRCSPRCLGRFGVPRWRPAYGGFGAAACSGLPPGGPTPHRAAT